MQVSITISYRKIGHIISENTFMMCPFFKKVFERGAGEKLFSKSSPLHIFT
jgi:hypothetical protein